MKVVKSPVIGTDVSHDAAQPKQYGKYLWLC